MTTTEIKIPDDAWMDWPDDRGWYLHCEPGEEAERLSWVTHNEVHHKQINNDSETITPLDKHRFARVILPVVPSKVNQ